MFQSIASCWPLLCWNKKGKKQALFLVEVCLVLSLVLQNVIAMHAGKVLVPRARENMVLDTRQIL